MGQARPCKGYCRRRLGQVIYRNTHKRPQPVQTVVFLHKVIYNKSNKRRFWAQEGGIYEQENMRVWLVFG